VRTANEDSNIVPSLKRSTDPCINVYLIDSISGAILGKLVHRGGAGPVHVVQSENFVVYHFWNNDQTQYEMSVLQLYEDEDTSKGMVRGDEFSSFQTLSPRIEQQTFVLEAAVAHLAVSSTQNGVTSKEVLVGLENGQVLGISKQQVLNVRRPLGAPTAHDKADMLMPYAREIPMLPTKIRSYKHTIQNLRNIVTTHALLESQSLVLAYGLDVFFTHVTPAGGFDLLSDEFNKPMLVLTVCGVAAALYFAKMFAAKKQLKEAWA
jgi:hypothetical protein